jgi:hypothetical protein
MKAAGLCLGLALALAASSVEAETELDLHGELSFWVGDADALGESEHAASSYFGEEPSSALSFDELSARENARARRLTLGVSARSPSLLWRGSSSVRLRLGVEHEPASGQWRFRDQGSHLELEQQSDATVRTLRVFPIDGDGLRAGWLEALAWGGEAGALRESPYASANGLVPALMLAQSTPWLRLWLGAKAARLAVPGVDGLERESLEYGALGGVEISPTGWLELGLNAGALRHGAMAQRDVRGQALVTAGASARVVVRRDLDPPELAGVFPDHVEGLAEGELGFALSVEGAWLEQRLKVADFYRTVRFTPALGGAALAAVGFGEVELVAGLMLRDAAFVTRQGPGALLPEAPPPNRPVEPEWSYVFEGRFGLTSLLTAVLDFGLRRPAFELVPAVSNRGSSAVVMRGPRRVELLPSGARPLPVLEARGAISVELSATARAALFVEYRRDGNRVELERRLDDIRWERSLAGPHSLGYGLALKAAL